MEENKTTEEVKQEGEFKIKKKPGRPKKLTNKSTDTPKINLNKKEEDAVQAQETSDSDVVVEEKKDETSSTQVVEEIRDAEKVEETKEESKSEDTPVISEITEQPVEEEEIKEVEQPKNDLPENIEKLVNFMKETGGDINDYVRLNADYSNVDEDTLLKEYYKNTKPHLDTEEINFIMEEKFKVDEDYDEERDQRRKKLAKKEEVAKARKFLDGLKEKYYEEIKLRPTVNNELTKAKEFFDKFSKDKEIARKQHESFKQDTKNFFSNEFKGFEFSVGEKRFRYGVSNPDDVANAQSDISNVVKKFLNDKGEVVDVKGYHKAMYAARNADTIAQHFYEQGKADAVKDVVAKSKNINTEARKSAPEDIYLNGLKVKAVSGVNSSKLKIKKR
jgi:hypothetical protein